MEVMRGRDLGFWGSNWRLPGFGRAEEVVRKVALVVMIMKMMMVVAVVVMIMKMMMVLAMVVMVRLTGKGFKEKKDIIFCESYKTGLVVIEMVAQGSGDDTITEMVITNPKMKTNTMTNNLRPLAFCGIMLIFIFRKTEITSANTNYKVYNICVWQNTK